LPKKKKGLGKGSESCCMTENVWVDRGNDGRSNFLSWNTARGNPWWWWWWQQLQLVLCTTHYAGECEARSMHRKGVK